MGRLAKARRVCGLPVYARFMPQPDDAKAPVRMEVEDFECIRLMDYLGMTQEECAVQMGVARTTVQAIYTRARRRLAGALVEGRPLVITGGNFEVCTQAGFSCGRPCCTRLPHTSAIARTNPAISSTNVAAVAAADATTGSYATDSHITKGRISMRVAIPYDEGQVFQHFGKSERFKLYDVTDGAITSSKVLESNGAGHGALVTLLKEEHVEVLICGGIGTGAQNALKEAGIRFYGGVQGNADEVVADFLADRLAYDPAVHCEHHGESEGHGYGCHHHHGEGHGHGSHHGEGHHAHGCHHGDGKNHNSNHED